MSSLFYLFHTINPCYMEPSDDGFAINPMHIAPAMDEPDEGIVSQHNSECETAMDAVSNFREKLMGLLAESDAEDIAENCYIQGDHDDALEGIDTLCEAMAIGATFFAICDVYNPDEDMYDEGDCDTVVWAPYRNKDGSASVVRYAIRY